MCLGLASKELHEGELWCPACYGRGQRYKFPIPPNFTAASAAESAPASSSKPSSTSLRALFVANREELRKASKPFKEAVQDGKMVDKGHAQVFFQALHVMKQHMDEGIRTLDGHHDLARLVVRTTSTVVTVILFFWQVEGRGSGTEAEAAAPCWAESA